MSTENPIEKPQNPLEKLSEQAENLMNLGAEHGLNYGTPSNSLSKKEEKNLENEAVLDALAIYQELYPGDLDLENGKF